jgi:hypothetical protein
LQAPAQVYQGHKNSKNFVGLSVRSAGSACGDDGWLMACGSETESVYVYHSDQCTPLSTRRMLSGASDIQTDGRADVPTRPGEASRRAAQPLGSACDSEARPALGFVSSVCWQPAVSHGQPLLAVGLSNGDVRVAGLV